MTSCYLVGMSLRARVKDGRLVLDEPTALPEGTEVELVPVEELDEVDDGERAKLTALLVESFRTHVVGAGIPAEQLLQKLRSQH